MYNKSKLTNSQMTKATKQETDRTAEAWDYDLNISKKLQKLNENRNDNKQPGHTA